MKEIRLSQGKVALVDDIDYTRLIQFSWCAVNEHGYWYALGWVNGSNVFMHRFIIGTPKGKITDHINGNGLDNRRKNLRVCTVAQNTHNQSRQVRSKSSKFKGVYWYKPRNVWRSIIRINMKRLYLGHFKSEIDAAIAYNNAALKYHGEFANLNTL